MSFPGLPAVGSSSESDSGSRASWSSLSSVREVRGRGHSDDQCPALPQLKQASASALAGLVLGMCLGGTDGLGEEDNIRKEREVEMRS